MPVPAGLQNSHRNGGGIFLIFVADPITVRSCTNRSRRAERSSQMVFSCMFKQQRRGPGRARRAAHRPLSLNAVCANVEARCDGSAPGTASRPRGPTTAGPADTTRRSGAPTHPTQRVREPHAARWASVYQCVGGTLPHFIYMAHSSRRSCCLAEVSWRHEGGRRRKPIEGGRPSRAKPLVRPDAAPLRRSVDDP